MRRRSLRIGPVVAGVLIVQVGPSNVLWVNAVVFTLSALLRLTLIPPVAAPPREVDRPASFRANTLVGF